MPYSKHYRKQSDVIFRLSQICTKLSRSAFNSGFLNSSSKYFKIQSKETYNNQSTKCKLIIYMKFGALLHFITGNICQELLTVNKKY